MKKKLVYICRCIYYVLKAMKLSKCQDVDKSWLYLCKDIIQCRNRYFATFSQYAELQIYKLSEAEKHEVLMRIKTQEDEMRIREGSKKKWKEVYDNDWAFLNKWSQLRWESTMSRRIKRTNAYIKHYGLNKKCWFQYDVKIICEHNSIGKLKVGEHVLFARGCDIDYTGDIEIGDCVAFSEGVKVLTHNHEIYLGEDENKCIHTPLVIKDRVWFGSRAVVMPGVVEIGRGAMIASGACVTKKIPPYAVVMGNPAKIVGFKDTPEEIFELERSLYKEDDRLPLDLLEKNYEKYYLSRLKEIKKYLSLSC